MRNVLTVARQGFVEKRVILAAAAVAALIPLIVPLLPSVDPSSAGVARNTTAVIVAGSFALISALIYGASCIGRDLRERRLSFYFSRPISGYSLWAGKMLAGALLVAGAFLLALLPAIAFGWGELAQDWGGVRTLLAAFVALILIMVFSHAGAVMLASRSPWIILDLVGLLVVGGSTVALLRLIARAPAYGVVEWASWSLAAVFATALFAAGLVQVVVGRADARRGHRALSLTLWGCMAGAAVLLGGYVVFLFHPTPQSLTSIWVVGGSPRGSFIAVTGPSRWRGQLQAAFLVDTASSRWLRLGPSWQIHGQVAFAASGSRAVWLETVRGGGDPSFQLSSCDLTSSALSPQGTSIMLPWRTGALLAISEDGTLVALWSEGLVAIHELPGGRLIASVRVQESRFERAEFVGGEGRLRIERWVTPEPGRPRELLISSFDPARSQLRDTGRLVVPPDSALWRPASAAQGHVLVQRRDGDTITLTVHDAWSGAAIAELVRREDPDRSINWWTPPVAYLSDGRVAVGDADRSGGRIRLFSDDWQPAGVVELGAWSRVAVAAEAEPGKLAVLAGARASERKSDLSIREECFILDLATGARTPLAAGVRPARSYWWSIGRRAAAPGSALARLFVSAEGKLLTWDPATGALRPLPAMR